VPGPRSRARVEVERSGSVELAVPDAGDDEEGFIDDAFNDEPTLMGGVYDPTIEQSQEIAPIRPGKQLAKLRDHLAGCVADPSHNFARINISRLELNLRGVGKVEVLGRTFTVVRTRKNLFLLSNESLVEFQNMHHELMGMDLTRYSVYTTLAGKPLIFTLVTAADVEAMRKAGTASSRMSAAAGESHKAHLDSAGSLLLPRLQGTGDDDEIDAIPIDLDEFREKIARVRRDPGCIEFFAPADFARRIVFVMAFYDDSGEGYYLITAAEGGGERSYVLRVMPARPANPSLTDICLLNGPEFCTLAPE
jgi:hypothetical protein